MPSLPSNPAMTPTPLPTPATAEQVAALPEVQAAESTLQSKLYNEMHAQQHDQWVRNPSSDPLGAWHAKLTTPVAQEQNNAKVTQYMAPPIGKSLFVGLGTAVGLGILGVILRNKLGSGLKRLAIPFLGLYILGMTAFDAAVQRKLNERYKHMIALNGGDPNTTLAQGRAAMQAHGEDPTLKPFIPYLANYTISPF